MAYSLGLTLYNLSQRRTAEGAALHQRPPGRLAWFHAPNAAAAGRLSDLAHALIDEDGFAVLLTVPPGVETTLPTEAGLIVAPAPQDHSAEAVLQLDHWRPEVIVFAEGELRPSLVMEAHARRIPLLMVDGRAPVLLRGREGWYPGLMRSVLSCFHQVFALSEDAARAFRKSGSPVSQVSVSGRLEERSVTLPASETERDALARMLASRPVWFAASVVDAELDAVIAAHRTALSQAHRLLLILGPADADSAEVVAARIAGAGLSVATRGVAGDPDTDTEVFVVDVPEEYGLWYRLAPVTFLGGSLSGTGSLRNPMEPAALGSAIVTGPRTGRFGEAFQRLGTAQALRSISSEKELPRALSDVLLPDRSARLAQAAWLVTSDGADVTERVLQTLRKLTDGPA